MRKGGGSPNWFGAAFFDLSQKKKGGGGGGKGKEKRGGDPSHIESGGERGGSRGDDFHNII